MRVGISISSSSGFAGYVTWPLCGLVLHGQQISIIIPRLLAGILGLKKHKFVMARTDKSDVIRKHLFLRGYQFTISDNDEEWQLVIYAPFNSPVCVELGKT
jgi:hypothetical protein